MKWRKITAITPFRVIQGRQFRYQWKAHNAYATSCASIIVTYLVFSNVFDIWRIIGPISAVNIGVPVFNARTGWMVRWGWVPKFRNTKFGFKKLEASLCRYLEPLRRDSRMRRTEGRRTDSLIAYAALTTWRGQKRWAEKSAKHSESVWSECGVWDDDQCMVGRIWEWADWVDSLEWKRGGVMDRRSENETGDMWRAISPSRRNEAASWCNERCVIVCVSCVNACGVLDARGHLLDDIYLAVTLRTHWYDNENNALDSAVSCRRNCHTRSCALWNKIRLTRCLRHGISAIISLSVSWLAIWPSCRTAVEMRKTFNLFDV